MALTTSVWTAVAAVCLTLPAMAQAGSVATGQQAGAPIRGEREAVKMVPAQVALKQTLTAASLTPGTEFETVLAAKVQLNGGPELPQGTILKGTVVEDDMGMQGGELLALRFTTAQLKNGQVVPIRATIVNFEQPETDNVEGYAVSPGRQLTNKWTDQTLKVDQLGVTKGVDLHSAVASKNSGVFVAQPNKHIKLAAGSEMALAIAARADASQQPPAGQ